MATKRESQKSAVPAKKRGGQFGNRNAYRHGFYTCAYHASELPEISSRGKGLRDDENLLRVMLENYAQKIRPENNLSFKETITALHTVAMTLARLDSLDCKSIRLNVIATPDQDLIDGFKNMGCTDEEIQAMIDGLPPPSQTAKTRAEGLAAYIKAENKKGKKLFGGIVVPKDGSWRFNDSEKYDYSSTLNGWKFLE